MKFLHLNELKTVIAPQHLKDIVFFISMYVPSYLASHEYHLPISNYTSKDKHLKHRAWIMVAQDNVGKYGRFKKKHLQEIKKNTERFPFKTKTTIFPLDCILWWFRDTPFSSSHTAVCLSVLGVERWGHRVRKGEEHFHPVQKGSVFEVKKYNNALDNGNWLIMVRVWASKFW